MASHIYSQTTMHIGKPRFQSGSSLIVVLMLLTVILIMGVISSRLSLFSERSARNDRERQVAFQSAEAALLDAEIDMMGPNSLAGNRVCVFDSKQPAVFIQGCGSGSKAGMCLNSAAPSAAWKSVTGLYSSETGTGGTNKTVEYGQFTGQTLPQGSSGLPAKLPRYIIEAVRYTGTGSADDNVGSSTTPEYAFLVTAMGFGTRVETRVLLQALVYKPANKPNSGC
jgi:type IV pilus assembly protein PilX